MRSINFIGTGSENGQRMVPLLTSYSARSSLNAAMRAIVSDYIQQSEDRDEPAILVS